MESIEDLIDGRVPAGFYAVDHLDPEAVQAYAESKGWGCGLVEGDSLLDRDGALVAIGRALGFPEHYGTNLDALADCLGELSQPTLLMWRGRNEILDQARIAEVLAERVNDEPTFAMLIGVPEQS